MKQAPRQLNMSPLCLHATKLPLCMPKSIAARPYQLHVSTHAASTTPHQLQPFPIHPLLSFTPKTHIPNCRAVHVVCYSSGSFHPCTHCHQQNEPMLPSLQLAFPCSSSHAWTSCQPTLFQQGFKCLSNIPNFCGMRKIKI